MANPVKILGMGVVYIGLGALFTMAIIGTMSLDLLLLCMLSQSNSRNNNFLTTLFMWNIMLSNRSSLYENIGFSLLASPFISAISIGLSVAVGLPEFGVLLLAGWVGAFTILLVGAAIYGLGDTLGNVFSNMDSTRGHRAEASFTHSSTRTMGHTFTVASTPQDQFYNSAANQPQYGYDQKHYPSPLFTANGPAPAPSAPKMDDNDGLPTYDQVQADTAAYQQTTNKM